MVRPYRIWRLAPAALVAALLPVSSVHGAKPPADPGERIISLYNIHTKETLNVTYKRGGTYVPAALKQINWALRDWRTNEPTEMDPELIDLVWQIHTELGSRQPIHVISAYRSPTTNAMLRRTRGGQARRSQHILGKAMDVTFPDVPVRRLRYSALVQEQGGVGYYPTSATPFVHVDTGRVRHWPRMRRNELALLFPHGRTQHNPASGGPISRSDWEEARRAEPELANQLAEYHAFRRERLIALRAPPSQGNSLAALGAAPTPPALDPVRPPQPRPAVAALTGGWGYRLTRPPTPATPPPRLLEPPRQIARPAPPAKPVYDENRLTQLVMASLTPPQVPSQTPSSRAPALLSLSSPPSWAPAPAHDEEHPEELSYSPFPIVPFITDTASADDPALRRLVHPDAERTLALLDDETNMGPPMQLRPGPITAQLLWAKAFTGRAVDLSALHTAETPADRPMLGQRRVATAGQ